MTETEWLYLVSFVLLVVVLSQAGYIYSLRSKNQALSKDNHLKGDTIKRLESEQLKYKLQPHTLGNALCAINSKISNLKKAMDAFSEVSEYVLYSSDDRMVSIKEELDFIDDFLKFKELLYSRSFCIHREVSPAVQQSAHYTLKILPPLLLVPLVENAFEHGNVEDPEFLKISADIRDGQFIFEVTNKIRKFNQEKANQNGGFGLSALQKRMEIFFGSAAQFESRKEDDYYFARITLHLREPASKTSPAYAQDRHS